MSEVVRADRVSAETVELVLGQGDLSKLTSAQRVEYMTKVCQTIGLNPLTRPFRFLNFQGQTLMYATRDCTDQLRNLRKVNVRVVDKKMDGGLFIVTAQARTPDGREDEDIGAVFLGNIHGDARANGIMKAMTKAKRRVTLSICGLGFPDETEVETMSGAQTFDAEEEVAPLPKLEDPPAGTRAAINQEVPLKPSKQTASQWLDELEGSLMACETMQEYSAIDQSPRVMRAKQDLQGAALSKLWQMLSEHKQRLLLPPGGENDEGEMES